MFGKHYRIHIAFVECVHYTQTEDTSFVDFISFPFDAAVWHRTMFIRTYFTHLLLLYTLIQCIDSHKIDRNQRDIHHCRNLVHPEISSFVFFGKKKIDFRWNKIHFDKPQRGQEDLWPEKLDLFGRFNKT